MKNISQINKNRLLAVLFAFSLQTPGDAQIADFIVNQIEDYISGQVNSVLHSTESYLGSWGTSIWESVVASKAESDLKKKAEEFKNFEPQKVELEDLENRYSTYARVTPYTSIYSQNAEYIQSMIHSQKNIVLKNFGKGTVEGSFESLEKGIQERMVVHNLIDVLSSTVLDSINHYLISAPNLEECLLSDIQHDYRLSEFLNNHPAAVKVYYNSINAPSLRGDTRHLFYWTEQADSHRSSLSQKAKLLDPKQIGFEEDEKRHVRISYNDQTLGYIDGHQITCENIELLNLLARPNTLYVYNNTTYYTDALGRIISTKQKVSATNKRKCSKKSLIKKKEYIAVHGSKSVRQPFSTALIEYGAPDILQNSFFYEKTASNKVVAKEMKRFYKVACKSYNESIIETQLEYNDCGLIPCRISINGVKNWLENISILPL